MFEACLDNMANIIRRPGWHLAERRVTPEAVFLNRRHFLQTMGFAGGGLLAAGLAGCAKSAAETSKADDGVKAASAKGYPAARNSEFNPGWPLTNEKAAATYNNFYEFSTSKERVCKLVGKFEITPWPVEIGGLGAQASGGASAPRKPGFAISLFTIIRRAVSNRIGVTDACPLAHLIHGIAGIR